MDEYTELEVLSDEIVAALVEVECAELYAFTDEKILDCFWVVAVDDFVVDVECWDEMANVCEEDLVDSSLVEEDNLLENVWVDEDNLVKDVEEWWEEVGEVWVDVDKLVEDVGVVSVELSVEDLTDDFSVENWQSERVTFCWLLQESLEHLVDGTLQQILQGETIR